MGQPDDIRRYLDENGATYTDEALRAKLLEAGYADADIDAALTEWRAARSGSESDQRTFRRWAIWFHLGALAAMVIVVLVLKGAGNGGVLVIGAAILAGALAIGWWLSSLIGRALLPRTGVTVALLLPLISALVLGGTCIGLMNAVIPTPPLDGTATLEITSPDAFSGSASAACYTNNSGSVSQVISQSLGEIDGLTVIVSVNPPPDGGEFHMNVELFNEQPGDYRGYAKTAETEYHVDMLNAGVSGQVSFSNLTAGPTGESLEPLSGTVTWTCEG